MEEKRLSDEQIEAVAEALVKIVPPSEWARLYEFFHPGERREINPMDITDNTRNGALDAPSVDASRSTAAGKKQ